MSARYLQRARRHTVLGTIAALLAVLFAAWSFIAALSEEPGPSIAAACVCVFWIFIATIETKEALRCLSIAARWVRWDREAQKQKL